MKEELEFIAQTLSLNSAEISSSLPSCDELITTDLVKTLGYDRRRDKSIVKTKTSEGYPLWKVVNNNNEHIDIITVSYSFDLKTLLDSCKTSEATATVLTNGFQLALFNNSGESLIATFELSSISDELVNCMEALSKDGSIKQYVADKRFISIAKVVDKSLGDSDKSIISEDYCSRNSLSQADVLKYIKDNFKASNSGIELNKEKSDEIKESLSGLNSTIATQASTIAQQEAELKSKSNEIDKLKSEKNNLNRKVVELTSTIDQLRLNGSGDTNTHELLGSYRKQIESLSLELASINDKIQEKDRIIADLKSKLENKVDPKVAEAQELLDTIADNPDEPLSYVGVVDGNLYQAQTIEKFIGLSLQELYGVVTFDLMRYLFDGDIFVISDNPVRNDFLIGNKLYDIDLSNLSETDSIQRLKTLFNKFPSVTFLYKIIGNKNCDKGDLDTACDTIFDDSENVGLEEIEDIPAFDDENVDNDEKAEVQDEFIDSGLTDDSEYGVNDEMSYGEYQSWLYVSPYESIKKIYNTDKISDEAFSLITYGDMNVIPFKLRGESFSSTLNDIIVAMINFSTASKKPRIIGTYKFSSEKHHAYPVGTFADAVHIPYTRYEIAVKNLNDAMPLLDELCGLLGLNSELITFYYMANINLSDDEIYELGTGTVYESEISLDGSDLTESSQDKLDELIPKGNDLDCIVSGTMDNFLFDKNNVGEIKDKLITKVIALKTNQLVLSLTSESPDELANCIIQLIDHYNGNIETLVDKLGYIQDSNYKIISTSREEVNDPVAISYSEQEYFISAMKPYQAVDALIRIYNALTGDKNIGIRIGIDYQYFNFYHSYYISYEPNRDCAVKSLAEYLADSMVKAK